MDRWNQNMQRASQAEERSRHTSLSRMLELVPLDDSYRMMRSAERHMTQVSSQLVGVFRNLVCGKAKWPLFLFGPVGSGKSMAALSLCDFVKSPYYTTVETLMNDVMSGSDFWTKIRNAGLAVLDELGCRMKTTDLEYSSVKRFCDERELYARRIAIYVSNVEPDVIASQYDARIADRVLCGTVVKLNDKSRR